jgi:hypothetical protein
VATDDQRERAWGAVHDVIAIDLRPRGRYAKREAIQATGATEIEALAALVMLLEARQLSGR